VFGREVEEPVTDLVVFREALDRFLERKEEDRESPASLYRGGGGWVNC